MDESAKPHETEALDEIRREIDGIDDALLKLVSERLARAEAMASLKAGETGPPLRPGREITLLRRLVGAAAPGVEPELVVEIWRALIAASLGRQRRFDVIVGGGRGDPTRLHDIARRHFGTRARLAHVPDAQTALARVVEQPEACVALVPWLAAPGVGQWWPALSESRFHKLHLVAGLPLLRQAGEEPEAAIFAASAPEPAGGDATILIAFDPHHRLQRALNETGLAGRETARSEPRVLIRVEEFVAVNDPRAAALTSFGLEGVRVLGSFARL